MTRVLLADGHSDARSALSLLLQDLQMQVIGEADDWATTLTLAGAMQPDMVVIDWAIVPPESSLLVLRALCPAAVVIVLISHMEARQQAAFSVGADSFISKGETPDRVARRLRAAAAGLYRF